MTTRELENITRLVIDNINTFNMSRRITLGVTKGNKDVAHISGERALHKLDALITALKCCDAKVVTRYDVSALIFRLDVTYKDTTKSYISNADFKIYYK